MNKEYFEKLKRFFEKEDRFATHNDINIVEIRVGYAKVELCVAEKHLNAAGIGHGGLVFTLADLAMGLAAHSHGRMAVTLGADISYFSPAKRGSIITAEAEELSLRKSIATYLISVKDEEGELLASMKCQAFRKGELVL